MVWTIYQKKESEGCCINLVLKGECKLSLEVDKKKAFDALLQYVYDEQNYDELKQKIEELKELDNSARRRKVRCTYAMWKTRYGFDIIQYIRDHLYEAEPSKLVENALKEFDNFRRHDGLY